MLSWYLHHWRTCCDLIKFNTCPTSYRGCNWHVFTHAATALSFVKPSWQLFFPPLCLSLSKFSNLTKWLCSLLASHSHQNPAARQSGSAGWAFLSTASLPSWSSSLPRLWHGGRSREREHLAAFKRRDSDPHAVRLPTQRAPVCACQDYSLNQPVWSLFCSLHLFFSANLSSQGDLVSASKAELSTLSLSNNPLCIQLCTQYTQRSHAFDPTPGRR